MPFMRDRPEAEFPEAAQDWDLEQLYADLAQAKHLLAAYKRKELTETEKVHLKGLLCGYSPSQIAEKLHKSKRGVDAELCKTLYRYIETLTKRKANSLESWKDVVDWLAKYRKLPLVKLYQDRGEAPDVPVFFGRNEELETLKKWILEEGCRLVTILGIGGIGKTALCVKLTEELQDKFEFVIWRSLRYSPTIDEIITNLSQPLSQQIENFILTSSAISISSLLEYLQKYRCLIILDNYEGVMRGGNLAGKYIPGYEKYGELLRLVGESKHNSCLLLTSRETPQETALLSGESLPVRYYKLDGLTQDKAGELLQAQGLAYQKEFEKLIQSYTGNPLALKIVSHTIKNLFQGHVGKFLSQNTLVIGEIFWNLIEEQFERLSDLEKEIVYWLAIENKPVPIEKLHANILLSISKSELIVALESLFVRCLIEKKLEGESVLFTLQPMIMKYATKQLVEHIYEEIVEAIRYTSVDKIKHLRNQALVTFEEDRLEFRDIQLRLLVTPIRNKLKDFFRNESRIQYYFNQLLSMLENQSPQFIGYAKANLVHLLK